MGRAQGKQLQLPLPGADGEVANQGLLGGQGQEKGNLHSLRLCQLNSRGKELPGRSFWQHHPFYCRSPTGTAGPSSASQRKNFTPAGTSRKNNKQRNALTPSVLSPIPDG